MPSYRRHSEAAQRAQERRLRENEAPRLAAEVPQLVSLRLEMKEFREGREIVESAHARQIVVGYAPALFEFVCGDKFCKDGGHDMTHAILAALRNGETHFEGEDMCQGYIGSTACMRVLKYVATATYKA